MISVLLIIAFFVFLIHNKKRNIQYFETNKTTSLIYGLTIITLHIAFTAYYAIGNGVYLYLLHTDICTMLYPWVSIALIFNFKKLQTILFPLAISGAFFELFTQQMTFGKDFAFNEIMSYAKHIVLILAGIYILLNQKNYKWIEFWKTITWLMIFILYIILVTGIPYWVTGNPKFGTFSMGFVEPSYEDVNASWTKTVMVSEYGVLKSWGYPFGTLTLFVIADLFGAAVSLSAVISSKYKIKQVNKFWPSIKKLVSITKS